MKPTPTPEMIEALEVARDQIITMYRTWVVDDATAMPTEISLAGRAIAKIDAALSVPAAAVVGEPVAAFHVKVKGWGEELCFTEDGAQSLINRLRRTKGQDGEATITPLYATTPKCSVCGDSGVEEVYGGHGTVMELPCSICTAAPSAPDAAKPSQQPHLAGSGMRELRASLIARTVRQSLRNYGHKIAESVLPECIAADVERALATDEKVD